MSGKKYVPEGVFLVCDKGTVPSPLTSLSYRETTLFGEHMTTKMDKLLIVNFPPMGACACAGGSPCTAPVTDWTNVTEAITLGGNELLLEDSELPCTLGGNIKIFYSLADAMAALPEQEKGFWDTLMDINNTIQDFRTGVAKGLWKGLKGTVTGVADLVVWAGKHHPIYQMVNPQGYAEQIENDKKTMKSLGNLAKKGGTWVYRNSTVNMLTDPTDYIAAQQENAVMMDKMMDKAANMSAEEWGELTGEIAFEVVLEVATAGGAAALTTIKVADKTVDIARTLDKLEDLGDGVKALEKIEDGAKLPPAPKELGDVYHVKSNAYAQSVLDNIDPQYFGKDNRFADGFYVAKKGETAIAEVTYHGGDMAESSVIRFSMDDSNLKVLDLTDPDVAKAWKYDEALKFEDDVVKGVLEDAGKYDKTIELSNQARKEGYNAIKFGSQRSDGVNMVIYETPAAPVNDVLKPQMIMPATD